MFVYCSCYCLFFVRNENFEICPDEFSCVGNSNSITLRKNTKKNAYYLGPLNSNNSVQYNPNKTVETKTIKAAGSAGQLGGGKIKGKDLKTELDNLIRFETDRQLNQFSIIYFNKLKLRSKISHE